MNKSELVAAIAQKADISKRQAEATLDSTVATIADALAEGDSVRLVGFGTFEVRTRAGRTGRDLRTGEVIEIPAMKTPGFKAGKTLKDRVRNI